MKTYGKIFFLVIVILAIGACQNQSKNVKTFVDANDILSYDLAKKYVQNYERHAGYVASLYSDSLGKLQSVKLPNTKSIWFSIARLETVVSKIKAEGDDDIRIIKIVTTCTIQRILKIVMYHQKIVGFTTPLLWSLQRIALANSKEITNQIQK